jgi:glycerol uptake facilitator-like aquaporin
MNLPPLIKKFLAEFLGVTLFMTAYFGSLFSQSPLGPLGSAAVLGLAILVTLPISGGHLNPIVSIYFFSRREISLIELLTYLLSQFVGAVFGLFIAGQMFGIQLQMASGSASAEMSPLISELFVAGGLVWLFGRLASTSKAHMIPAAVGLWVFAGTVFSTSGGQANPAISVARLLLDQSVAQSAGYVLAQLGGMLIAAVFVLVFADKKIKAVEEK